MARGPGAPSKEKQMRIHWHIEGTLDKQASGVVVDILEWPFVGGVRAYIVEPDDPKVTTSIIPVDRVVEEEE